MFKIVKELPVKTYIIAVMLLCISAFIVCLCFSVKHNLVIEECAENLYKEYTQVLYPLLDSFEYEKLNNTAYVESLSYLCKIIYFYEECCKSLENRLFYSNSGRFLYSFLDDVSFILINNKKQHLFKAIQANKKLFDLYSVNLDKSDSYYEAYVKTRQDFLNTEEYNIFEDNFSDNT